MARPCFAFCIVLLAGCSATGIRWRGTAPTHQNDGRRTQLVAAEHQLSFRAVVYNSSPHGYVRVVLHEQPVLRVELAPMRALLATGRTLRLEAKGPIEYAWELYPNEAYRDLSWGPERATDYRPHALSCRPELTYEIAHPGGFQLACEKDLVVRYVPKSDRVPREVSIPQPATGWVDFPPCPEFSFHNPDEAAFALWQPLQSIDIPPPEAGALRPDRIATLESVSSFASNDRYEDYLRSPYETITDLILRVDYKRAQFGYRGDARMEFWSLDESDDWLQTQLFSIPVQLDGYLRAEVDLRPHLQTLLAHRFDIGFRLALPSAQGKPVCPDNPREFRTWEHVEAYLAAQPLDALQGLESIHAADEQLRWSVHAFYARYGLYPPEFRERARLYIEELPAFSNGMKELHAAIEDRLAALRTARERLEPEAASLADALGQAQDFEALARLEGELAAFKQGVPEPAAGLLAEAEQARTHHLWHDFEQTWEGRSLGSGGKSTTMANNSARRHRPIRGASTRMTSSLSIASRDPGHHQRASSRNITGCWSSWRRTSTGCAKRRLS